MPRRPVTVVTPPEAEPVTLAELKARARVDTDDDDGLLDTCLVAARQAAEEYLRRSLVTRTLRLTLDAPPGGLDRWLGDGVYDLPVSALSGPLPTAIDLPAPPLVDIVSVVTYDAANTASTYDPANYRADAAGSRLVLNRDAAWPSGLRDRAAVEVTYTAGYGPAAGDVPAPIRAAVLAHAAALYDSGGCDVPAPAERLLRPYRVMA